MPEARVPAVPRSTIAVSLLWQSSVAVVLCILAVLAVEPGPATLPLLYLAAVTPALVVSDLTVCRLPNRLVLPAYLVILAALPLQWAVHGEFPLAALISGLAYFGLMLALSAMGGMGMGDVKLAGALGFTAGMFGLETALASPLLAFMAGGVAAAIALVAARGRRGLRIPFGPFMLAGLWAAVLLPV